MAKDKFKYAVPAPRQCDGDDGYCWVVFLYGSRKWEGLTRTEASYYRLSEENNERKRKGEQSLVRG